MTVEQHESGLFEVKRMEQLGVDCMTNDLRLMHGYLWVRRTGADHWLCTHLFSRKQLAARVSLEGAEGFLATCEQYDQDHNALAELDAVVDILDRRPSMFHTD